MLAVAGESIDDGWMCAWLTIVMLCMSTGAFADEQSNDADAPPPRVAPVRIAPTIVPPASVAESGTITSWYGWQIVLADLGTLAIAAATRQPGVGVGLVVTGPIAHLAHGHGGRAVGSLLLRGLLPVGGAALGYSAEGCQGGEFLCGAGGIIIGGLVGAIAAEAIDLGTLANDETPVQTIVPVVSIHPNDIVVGFARGF